MGFVSLLLVIDKLFIFQERYRNDCNLAVHLLQCKPSNFVAQKLKAVSLQHFLLCKFCQLYLPFMLMVI